jgi:hypothetical protein
MTDISDKLLFNRVSEYKHTKHGSQMLFPAPPPRGYFLPTLRSVVHITITWQRYAVTVTFTKIKVTTKWSALPQAYLQVCCSSISYIYFSILLICNPIQIRTRRLESELPWIWPMKLLSRSSLWVNHKLLLSVSNEMLHYITFFQILKNTKHHIKFTARIR